MKTSKSVRRLQGGSHTHVVVVTTSSDDVDRTPSVRRDVTVRCGESNRVVCCIETVFKFNSHQQLTWKDSRLHRVAAAASAGRKTHRSIGGRACLIKRVWSGLVLLISLVVLTEAARWERSWSDAGLVQFVRMDYRVEWKLNTEFVEFFNLNRYFYDDCHFIDLCREILI